MMLLTFTGGGPRNLTGLRCTAFIGAVEPPAQVREADFSILGGNDVFLSKKKVRYSNERSHDQCMISKDRLEQCRCSAQ